MREAHEVRSPWDKSRKDRASAGKSFYYTPQLARDMKNIRVGFAPVDFEEWADPGTRPAFQEALKVIRDCGAELVETKLPDLPFGLAAGAIISAEGSAVFEPLIESGKVDELADQKQIAGWWPHSGSA